MADVIIIAFYFGIFIYSVIIHEVSHGLAALWLGDKTAQYAGRLTLNPTSHIDPLGSVILPGILFLTTGYAFGWAKPVPYNPYNLNDQKWGSLWVAFAGPGSNIVLALICTVIAAMLPMETVAKAEIIRYVSWHDWEALTHAITGSVSAVVYMLCIMGIIWNVLLAVFNLLSIPPWDGI